jgi:hypothetical protein
MIEKMVVYERGIGIRFVVPKRPVPRIRNIYDSDDEDYEFAAIDEENAEYYDGAGRHTTIARLWLLSTSRPKPAPAKGILKRPGDGGKSKSSKKTVRWTGLGDESEADEEEKERRARESVRRKLAEGSELSKRFLVSFFGWSKHHHRKRSSDDGDEDDAEESEGQESADSDLGETDSSSTIISSADEAWYRTNLFENQTRNLNRLKELEMRLEEMVRSKGKLNGKGKARMSEDEGEVGSSNGEVSIVGEDQQQVVMVTTDGWAESPVYMSPPEAQPDEARLVAEAADDDNDDSGEGKQKRRRRDSFTGLLSSMSGARKKLLSR